MKIAFTLTGLTPLLMHSYDVESSDLLTEWRKDPNNKNLSKPGDDRSPPWTWQTYLYTDGERVVLPCDNLMVSIRQAGAQMILKRQKTYKEISQSGMRATDEFLEFTFSGGKSLAVADLLEVRDRSFGEQLAWAREQGFRLWSKPARVGTSKHVRVRARFDSWQCRGELLVVKQELTFDVLTRLFDIAGEGGLGDWRPACKTPGPFGMYRASISQID